MKTLIFDIDGTITDVWPLEKAVLTCMLGDTSERNISALKAAGINSTYTIFSKVTRRVLQKSEYVRQYNRTFNILLREGILPSVEKYPLAHWIINNQNRYRFVYVTGGQRAETLYVLKVLGLLRIFDLQNSLDKSTCRYTKSTGIPLRKVAVKFPDCMLIADGAGDCKGASLAGVAYIRVRPEQPNPLSF